MPMTVNSRLPVRMMRPMGFSCGKELIHQRGADQADIRRVLIFAGREVAPEVQRARVDIDHVGRVADDGGVVGLLVLVLHRERAAGRRAHFLAGLAQLGHRAVVGDIDVLVLQRLHDDREIDHRERSLGDAENVGAEVGDLLLDIEIRALHQRHHGDQGGDAHGQAEHRQRRPELVRTDGVDRQPQIVLDPDHGILWKLCFSQATIAS